MEKQRFEFNEAMLIASGLVTELTPHSIKIAIAGSIRRKKPFVGDIELVIIPKKINIGLFDEYPIMQTTPEIVRIINKYKKVRGLATGKSTQRLLPQGIKLDLFTATEDSWGLQLAMRTGSAAYSHQTLANRWSRMGYESRDGILRKEGKAYPLKEEIDVFNLLELEYVEPEYRM